MDLIIDITTPTSGTTPLIRIKTDIGIGTQVKVFDVNGNLKSLHVHPVSGLIFGTFRN